MGIAFIGYGYVRQRSVDAALARGEYAPFKNRAALFFTAVGIVLGVATLVLVAVHPT